MHDIKNKGFAGVRVYNSVINKFQREVMDFAVEADLPIMLGVDTTSVGPADVEHAVGAAIKGCQQHPDLVKAVLIGTEDMANLNGLVLEKIHEVKQKCPNTLVTTALQTQTDYRQYDTVKAASDNSLMINAFPIFSPANCGDLFSVLKAQVADARKYVSGQLIITTGTPKAG